MSAPVPATRIPPTGQPMTNGFPIQMVFSLAPDVPIWGVSITPPGIDGGDPIDTTNQHNEEWRTMAMRILKTLSKAKLVAQWNPLSYNDISTKLINKEGVITIVFPTNPKLAIAFYGGMKDFQPQEIEEGSTEPPKAEFEIVPTMCDPNDPQRKEEGPVIQFI